jgi:hypothetical protein
MCVTVICLETVYTGLLELFNYGYSLSGVRLSVEGGKCCVSIEVNCDLV